MDDDTLSAVSYYLVDKGQHAKRSTSCLRKGVAASAMFEKRLIATEINGPVNGGACKNVPGQCGCEHAEQKLLRHPAVLASTKPLVLLTTYAPCVGCAEAILSSGKFCAWYYYHDAHHHKAALDYLHQRRFRIYKVPRLGCDMCNDVPCSCPM